MPPPNPIVYALLFIATVATAAISGAAGFGGALLLLPLLVATVGVEQAVPLLTIAQLVGNLSRVAFGYAQIHWKPVLLFLLGAVPSSALGAWSFVQLPREIATRAIGAAILVFVLLRSRNVGLFQNQTALLVGGGLLVGFLSGLVGSAGPLGAAIFLSLGLPPVAYISSEAATALAMHAVKTFVYQRHLPFGPDSWFLALLISLAMILGTWSARNFIERLQPDTFRRFVGTLLIALSLYMLLHG